MNPTDRVTALTGSALTGEAAVTSGYARTWRSSSCRPRPAWVKVTGAAYL
jgi:hypothetical protein